VGFKIPEKQVSADALVITFTPEMGTTRNRIVVGLRMETRITKESYDVLESIIRFGSPKGHTDGNNWHIKHQRI